MSALIEKKAFADLVTCSFKTPPVRKVPESNRNFSVYEEIRDEWETLSEIARELVSHYAESYYTPFLILFNRFEEELDDVKMNHGKVFIEDINFRLSEYLNSEIIPDIYFRLGETICHYLIDEFQDTAPIQWRNLYPLIENVLSEAGSFFIVGDTKQAIYGFRGADFRIMRKLEDRSPFPSSSRDVKELFINYRSQEEILRFADRVFTEILRESRYREAADMSGLTEFNQKPRDTLLGKGHVELVLIDRDLSALPEKLILQNLIDELHSRGYGYRDIAILTPRNYDVVQVTSWLNEKDIPFLSFSSLDIRQRRLTGEIISALKFLDSPIDDRSLASFLLGEIFQKASAPYGMKEEMIHQLLLKYRKNLIKSSGTEVPGTKHSSSHMERPLHRTGLKEDGDFYDRYHRHTRGSSLYKVFQNEFPEVWMGLFERLFNLTGYLPLYDLVTEVLRAFRVFENFQDETATPVRILEVIKRFEDSGINSLKDFIDYSEKSGDDTEWTIDVPRGIEAVNVMTVHKAKGLGFPVVVVLLRGERLNRGFPYIVRETEGGASLLRINRDIIRTNPEYERIYNDEVMNKATNSLNTLYVGFTRAEAEMYVLAVKGERDIYPFDLLPFDDFPPSERPEEIYAEVSQKTPTAPLYYHDSAIEISVDPTLRLHIEEKRRGEFYHEVLSHVEFVDQNLEQPLNDAIVKLQKLRGEDFPLEEILNKLIAFLQMKDMRDFFSCRNGRIVFREKEFANRRGNLYRMDRVVVDSDRVTVIDFKTGEDTPEEEAKYVKQINDYMEILRDFYPDRPVGGVIAYIDMKKTKRVF
jgi:ATP-dependent exoDNAse (exonuclease V) beta subunit